jgi:hypothetical protein
MQPVRRPLVGLFVAAGLTCLFRAVPVSAQTTPTMTEAQQTAAIISLQSSLTALQNTVNSQATTITSLQSSVTSLKSTVNSQTAAITALQQKTAPLSLATDTTRADGKQNTELYLTGVNVHIVSGSGATNDFAFSADGSPVPGKSLFGLGNLTIGYNFNGNTQGTVRTGSHNLILGDSNNYSSFGGVVTGVNSVLGNRYSAILAGDTDIALGDSSVILGGEANTTQAQQGAIVGGHFNLVTSRFGSVLGGEYNIAGGPNDPNIASVTTVTGGQNNYAGGQDSTISGGRNVVMWAGFGWAAGSEGSQNSWFTNYRSPSLSGLKSSPQHTGQRNNVRNS